MQGCKCGPSPGGYASCDKAGSNTRGGSAAHAGPGTASGESLAERAHRLFSRVRVSAACVHLTGKNIVAVTTRFGYDSVAVALFQSHVAAGLGRIFWDSDTWYSIASTLRLLGVPLAPRSCRDLHGSAGAPCDLPCSGLICWAGYPQSILLRRRLCASMGMGRCGIATVVSQTHHRRGIAAWQFAIALVCAWQFAIAVVCAKTSWRRVHHCNWCPPCRDDCSGSAGICLATCGHDSKPIGAAGDTHLAIIRAHNKQEQAGLQPSHLESSQENVVHCQHCSIGTARISQRC
mmetsp:Transcript_52442/g.98401  ORF Transcript_52442/g.98401 Transcript_52442/m.98401 type:complete len:290 (+) Transcript_52442:4732-5601(+)